MGKTRKIIPATNLRYETSIYLNRLNKHYFFLHIDLFEQTFEAMMLNVKTTKYLYGWKNTVYKCVYFTWAKNIVDPKLLDF